MNINLPLFAGMISTVMFCFSTFPMLKKAFKTKDLHSYSPGQILLANAGNLVHSIYVFSLPVGPIWLLHSFHTATTGLMLLWYARYEWRTVVPNRIASGAFLSPRSRSALPDQIG